MIRVTIEAVAPAKATTTEVYPIATMYIQSRPPNHSATFFGESGDYDIRFEEHNIGNISHCTVKDHVRHRGIWSLLRDSMESVLMTKMEL